MPELCVVVQKLTLPALVIHGGAGAYLKTTSHAQRIERGRILARIVRHGYRSFDAGGARAATLAAIAQLEEDEGFNAGYGSRLQSDGVARLSAALMGGSEQRLSAVYNVQRCLHPSRLCDALQERPDRNLDGDGARRLMEELGLEPAEVRSPGSIARWQKLRQLGDRIDREAAIGSAGEDELDQARRELLPLPADLEEAQRVPGHDTSVPEDDPTDPSHVSPSSDEDNRYGTVGAVAADAAGVWACTSTGGRGHEAVGRISDSPTAAGTYACRAVALSATGFGEQIIDINLCGRIATRMLDGLALEEALRRTFAEAIACGGLFGVIALAPDGTAGYAHTTEACGVAWLDASGAVHLDQHGR